VYYKLDADSHLKKVLASSGAFIEATLKAPVLPNEKMAPDAKVIYSATTGPKNDIGGERVSVDLVRRQ